MTRGISRICPLAWMTVFLLAAWAGLGAFQAEGTCEEYDATRETASTSTGTWRTGAAPPPAAKAATPPPAAAGDAAAALMRQGMTLFNAKEYQKAAERFSAAVKADPRLAEAHRMLGEAHFFQDNYTAAVQDYSRAIEIDPKLASAYSARGVAKYLLKDPKGCLSDESKAIELNPNLLGAYTSRGLARFDLGDYAGSAADGDEIIRLQPTAQAYFNRGFVREKLGDLAGAASDYRKMLELDPKHRDAAEATARLKKLPAAAAATPRASTSGKGGAWYTHPGGGFRLPLPGEATVYARGGGEDVDAIAWPNLRLSIFCRRDSMAGDATKAFLRDAYRNAPGRTATTLTLAAPVAVVARYAADDEAMYWHLCLVHKGQTYYITVAAPASAPTASLPADARQVLERLEFLR
jgi:tetratricopeptide (TPR) repeat protein